MPLQLAFLQTFPNALEPCQLRCAGPAACDTAWLQEGGEAPVLADAAVLDLKQPAWQLLQPCEHPRCAHAAVAVPSWPSRQPGRP